MSDSCELIAVWLELLHSRNNLIQCWYLLLQSENDKMGGLLTPTSCWSFCQILASVRIREEKNYFCCDNKYYYFILLYLLINNVVFLRQLLLKTLATIKLVFLLCRNWPVLVIKQTVSLHTGGCPIALHYCCFIVA